MKIKHIFVGVLALIVSGCGSEGDPLNTLYSADYSDAENQLLKCGKKNMSAIKKLKGWEHITPDNAEFQTAMKFIKDCHDFHRQNLKGICQYDTDEKRQARDAVEKAYSEKSNELYQAFADSCIPKMGRDPKDAYLSKVKPKYKDMY